MAAVSGENKLLHQDSCTAVSGENKLLHQDSCTKPTYLFRLLSPSPDISAGASSRVKIVYWNFSK